MACVNKIAIVAKPWRGGLANYLGVALEECFPGRVCHIDTYPATRSEQYSYRLDKRSWRARLVDRIESLNADVVIFVNLLPEFSVLSGRPGYIMWLTDNPAPVLDYLTPFAHVFVSDPGYAELVRHVVGDRRFAGTLPFACHQVIHAPVASAKPPEGFCFIANRDTKRDYVLRYLFEHDRQVRVYGNYFMRHPLFWRYPRWFRPAVANERMGAVYARHLASLNIHAEVVKEGTNMRTFECAAYCVPQIIEYRPGLENYFDIGDELYVYHEVSELLDLMKAVEACPVEAKARAERARAHALDEHTYRRRIERMLSVL